MSEKTLEQLDREIEDIEQALIQTKNHIEKAQANLHANGEYADPIWYAKARTAVRCIEHKRQRLTKERKELRKATNIKVARDRESVFRRHFKAELKRRISETLYNEIAEVAGYLTDEEMKQ